MSRWARDVTERCISTFVLVFLGVWLAGLDHMPDTLHSLGDVSLLSQAAFAAVISVLTLAKGWLASKVGNADNASMSAL